VSELQRNYYRLLRRDWDKRHWYTARLAFDLARTAGLFKVERFEFYRRLRIE